MNNLRAKKDASSIDRHDLVPAIKRHARQIHAGPLPGGWIDSSAYTGDVAQDIDPAIFRLHIVDERRPFILLSNVQVSILALTASSNDLARHRYAQLVLQVTKHNAGTMASEHARRFLTNAGRATGYNGDFAW